LEKGGAVATNSMALTAWSVKYHKTMVAAEQTRLDITRATVTAEKVRLDVASGFGNFLAQLALWFPFVLVTRITEKLISSLTELEALPSSILLEAEAEKIPDSLRDLFRKMCEVLQKSEADELHKTILLGSHIERLSRLSQEIISFADRFEDAQKKLRTCVCPEEAAHYRGTIEAYKSCKLTPDQATDDDLKSHLLHF
jgi:hypothetical protein